MSGKLIPFGYGGRSPAQALVDLDALMENPQALIIDIRLMPFSRYYVDFSKYKLGGRYNRDRIGYHWEGDFLGNVNYKGGPIRIRAPESGVQLLLRHLKTHDVIILCACKHYDTCHRKVVAELVRAKFPTVEIIVA